jgi:hypothetical protein
MDAKLKSKLVDKFRDEGNVMISKKKGGAEEEE